MQQTREAETQAMITQIEIDGFKTFKDFKVELAPFQVIVGPNGSGKSNLFDALQLVSQLMIPGNDVYKAMQGIRGEAGELFTKYPDGTTSDTIRIAIEMLINPKSDFASEKEIDLKFARFRYELEIRAEKSEDTLYHKYFEKQHLKIILTDPDNWCKKYNIPPNTNIHNQTIILSNTTNKTDALKDLLEIALNNLKNRSPSLGQSKPLKSSDLPSVIKESLEYLEYLSRIQITYANAVKSELRSLSFYHFNPEALRKRSSTSAPRYLAPDGSNLPATLARIKAEDPVAFLLISHDITSLVSDILKVDVEKYDPIDEYGIRVTTSDKRTFTAQALSDGTLRLLALATLRNDPQFHGTICIEEPENGVQPLYLNEFARLLHDMTTDFADPEQANDPLRQVIVTTHSPAFISQPEVIDHLLLATTPTRIWPNTESSLTVTRMEPVMTPETLAKINIDPNEDRASKYYTINIVKQYLDGDILQQASEQLEQARSDLHKI